MATITLNDTLDKGVKAERKQFVTVVSWNSDGDSTEADDCVCVLGRRVEDASMEFNTDIEQTTDVLGINYTDVNKTQPQMTFDPAYIIGGDDLMQYLYDNALENNITAYSGIFHVTQVALFKSGASSGKTYYRGYMHEGCSVIPSSIGGDAYLQMPFDVYFSNSITKGVCELTFELDITKTVKFTFYKGDDPTDADNKLVDVTSPKN